MGLLSEDHARISEPASYTDGLRRGLEEVVETTPQHTIEELIDEAQELWDMFDGKNRSGTDNERAYYLGRYDAFMIAIRFRTQHP